MRRFLYTVFSIIALLIIFPINALAVENNGNVATEYYANDGYIPQLSIEEQKELGFLVLEEESISPDSDNSEYELLGSSAIEDCSTKTHAEVLYYLSQKVREALLNGQTKADLTGSNLDMDSFSYLYQLKYYCPYIDSANITISLGYNYDNSKWNYSSVNITNKLSQEETVARVEAVDAVIDDYYNTVYRSDKSELETALNLHDEIATRVEYSKPITNDSYYTYSMYINKKGVCQAYAYMYMYLLSKMGMESGYISSDTINHGWNAVRIDGNFYQVDITWDDPLYDKFGMAKHTFFLVSDATMATRESGGGSIHKDWTEDYSCIDTRYDDAFWYSEGVKTPIVKQGDYYYYITDTGLMKHIGSTNTTTSVLNVGTWYVWGNRYSYWTSTYSGLFEHDGLLYYNTPDSIKSYDPSSGKVELVASPDVSSGYVYGIRKSGNSIQYVIMQSPNDVWTEYLTINNVLPSVTPAPASSNSGYIISMDGKISLSCLFSANSIDKSFFERCKGIVKIDGVVYKEYTDITKCYNSKSDDFYFTAEVPLKDIDKTITYSFVYTPDGSSDSIKLCNDVSVSIKELLISQINSNSAERTEMWTDMLGAYNDASVYFGKATREASTASIKSQIREISMVAWDNYETRKSTMGISYLSSHKKIIREEQEGVKYIGSSLLLNGSTTIKHYFEIDESVNIQSLSVVVEGENVSLQPVCGNIYSLEITNIPSVNYGKSFNCNVGVTFIDYYSVYSYLYDVFMLNSDADLMELGKSLMLYERSSKTYFGV